MFGIGFLEICLIVVVGLVFIGPQNLPKVMLEVGKFFVQMKRMSNEVKSSVNEAVRDANLEELRKEDLNPKKAAQVVLDRLESEVFNDFEEKKPSPQKETPLKEGKIKAQS